MRHQTPDRPQQIAIAVVVIASLVAVYGGVQLLRGDDGGSKESSSSTPLDRPGSPRLLPDSDVDDPDTTDEELTDAIDEKGLDLDGPDLFASMPDVYANPQGPGRRLRVTLTLTSDGPVYQAHDYRDGRRGGPSVIDKTYTVTRTVRGPLPVARLAAQLLPGATYVTCRIAVDGTVVATHTANQGPGSVAGCVG